MAWTREEAFDFLKTVYTDDVMQDEKRRVFKMLNRQLYERLDDLAINQALSERSEKQLRLFKEFTFMPGDNIFQSMRYLFLMARGEKERDRRTTEEHLNRIYQSLFQAAAMKNPVIPDSFWETPLGIACTIAEKGVEAVYPILDEMT
ncbi:hypothetical protein [Tenuibacillus multivorans]|uniref:Uncharacterized protein n=1 Tax=Tenuibacillus multivorans TaxID=237069 RepID=A0A1G9WSY7_9BACI|nr:hypothetical protein [Tenuibacillus multivorans]GEL78437.1 hypothetical protein TMU01_26720 [Tenuibacillus multivorans]SDM87600.1 hypothetical protein SAMN05216498_0879 [Tenuibacillus multivorans]